MRVIYRTLNDVPAWGKPTVEKLIRKGILQGESAEELNLEYYMLRNLVINDRAGLFDNLDDIGTGGDGDGNGDGGDGNGDGGDGNGDGGDGDGNGDGGDGNGDGGDNTRRYATY